MGCFGTAIVDSILDLEDHIATDMIEGAQGYHSEGGHGANADGVFDHDLTLGVSCSSSCFAHFGNSRLKKLLAKYSSVYVGRIYRKNGRRFHFCKFILIEFCRFSLEIYLKLLLPRAHSQPLSWFWTKTTAVRFSFFHCGFNMTLKVRLRGLADLLRSERYWLSI